VDFNPSQATWGFNPIHSSSFPLYFVTTEQALSVIRCTEDFELTRLGLAY
jgi:hypothetical protein